MLIGRYLRLKPLSELHGDVHVGQTHGDVVHGVVVDRPRDLVPDHVLAPVLLRQGHGAWAGTRLAA